MLYFPRVQLRLSHFNSYLQHKIIKNPCSRGSMTLTWATSASKNETAFQLLKHTYAHTARCLSSARFVNFPIHPKLPSFEHHTLHAMPSIIRMSYLTILTAINNRPNARWHHPRWSTGIPSKGEGKFKTPVLYVYIIGHWW